MKTKLLSSNIEDTVNLGAGSGDTETYEYECPCGNGTIIEEHTNVPDFRKHDVYINCAECQKNDYLDTSKGVRNWDIVKKPV